MDISISYDDIDQIAEFLPLLGALAAYMGPYNPFLAIMGFAYLNIDFH